MCVYCNGGWLTESETGSEGRSVPRASQERDLRRDTVVVVTVELASKQLLLVVRPGAPFVASLFLVAMPGACSSIVLVPSSQSRLTAPPESKKGLLRGVACGHLRADQWLHMSYSRKESKNWFKGQSTENQ